MKSGKKNKIIFAATALVLACVLLPFTQSYAQNSNKPNEDALICLPESPFLRWLKLKHCSAADYQKLQKDIARAKIEIKHGKLEEKANLQLKNEEKADDSRIKPIHPDFVPPGPRPVDRLHNPKIPQLIRK
ncbi:MAG: hypothetical protein WC966_07930 [Bradymonadales bacterium]|jgi:hypothetical protein